MPTEITRIVGALGLVLVALLALGVDRSVSAPESSSTLRCPFAAELAYDVPVTYAGGEANFSSREIAIECSGGALAGAWTLRLLGTAGEAHAPVGGESCLRGAGYGRVELRRLPEGSAGEAHVVGNFEYHHVGPAWSGEGRLLDPSRGGLVLAAVERSGPGACVTGPKTGSVLSGEITVAGELDPAASAAPACANRVAGTARGDRLRGTREGDSLSGRGGPDRISGGRGADCISGGPGTDRISSGPGADVIRCGSGRDVVRHSRADVIRADCERVSRPGPRR